MAGDMNNTDLREVTTQFQPIYTKLQSGDTNLTQDDIDSFNRGYDTLQQYVSSSE